MQGEKETKRAKMTFRFSGKTMDDLTRLAGEQRTSKTQIAEIAIRSYAEREGSETETKPDDKTLRGMELSINAARKDLAVLKEFLNSFAVQQNMKNFYSTATLTNPVLADAEAAVAERIGIQKQYKDNR
jgi:predicted transcriptional regulator